MSERDELEELLKRTQEHRLHALEQELDQRLSRLWRAPERQLGRRALKPALALASVALFFLGAWLYDLSQPWEASSFMIFDARYERPQLALRKPGDPVRLTQQAAGVPEQEPEPTMRFIEPGLHTGVFSEKIAVSASLADEKGNRFFIADSKIVKVTPEDESSVIAENLSAPSSLAFDAEGNLLVVESGRGRVLRVEAVEGEVKAGSPVSVFAEGFARSTRELEDTKAMRESRSERLAWELKPEERVWPVYLTVNESGEIFIGGQASSGEAVVYKIERKRFKWWKFYCLYQC